MSMLFKDAKVRKGWKHLIELRYGMDEGRNSLQSLLVKQPSQAWDSVEKKEGKRLITEKAMS